MTEVGFYHLTRTTVEDALPALLGRTLDNARRALVVCANPSRVKHIDDTLWRAKEPVWLPHGTSKTGEPEHQPIWISDVALPANGATYLFLVDGQPAQQPDAFERIFDLFDGSDEAAVSAARGRWKTLVAMGYKPIYWRQEARGWRKGN